jgi:ribokinase
MTMARHRVRVLGSLNIDLTVKVADLPQPGETVVGGDMTISPGGKGANQATAAARLGATVSLFGRVGDDEFGHNVLAAAAADLIDVSGVRVQPNRRTGAALIVVDRLGQNTIAVALGANSDVDYSDADRMISTVERGDVVCLQLETPLKVVTRAAAAARQLGALVVLNAAPSHVLSGHKAPEADILIVNEAEASEIADMKIGGVEDAKRAAVILIRTLSAVVITLGDKGAVIGDHGIVRELKPFAVNGVDATGAGDAFVGGLVAGIVRGWSLEASARVGCAAGAAAVTKIGARTALPTSAELSQMFHVNLD